MNKKLSIIILCIISIFITGCFNNSYAYDFNSSSPSKCSLECSNYMKEFTCLEAIPRYSNTFLNGEQTKGICSCFVNYCNK